MLDWGMMILFHLLCVPSIAGTEDGNVVEVHWIRHGQSVHNKNEHDLNLAGLAAGAMDAALTELGWQEAERNKDVYNGQDPNDYVFASSPLRRAFATLVTATSGMKWEDIDVAATEKPHIYLRPEFREMGGADTTSLYLKEKSWKWFFLRSWQSVFLNENLAKLQKQLDRLKAGLLQYINMSGRETSSERENQSIQDPALNTRQYTNKEIDPKEPTAAGGDDKTIIRPEDYFTLDTSAIGLDWASKTLVRSFVTVKADTETKWQGHLKEAFKTLATLAKRADKPKNKKILIGGHSQLVYYMGRMAGWSDILKSSNGKIANGAILSFKVNAETGDIVAGDPKLDFAGRSSVTCFKNKDLNKKYCSICASQTTCSTDGQTQQKSGDMAFVGSAHTPAFSAVFPLCAVVFGVICTATVFLFKQNHAKGDAYVAFLNEEVDKI